MSSLHIDQLRAKLFYCYPKDFNCKDSLSRPGGMDSISALTLLTRKALLMNSLQGLDIIVEHMAVHSSNIYTSEEICPSQIDELLAFYHSRSFIVQTSICQKILEQVWLPTFNMNTMLEKMPSINALIAPYSRLFVLLLLANGHYSHNKYPHEPLALLAKLVGTYFYYCRCHAGIQAEHHLFALQALTSGRYSLPEIDDYELHLQFVMSI